MYILNVNAETERTPYPRRTPPPLYILSPFQHIVFIAKIIDLGLYLHTETNVSSCTLWAIIILLQLCIEKQPFNGPVLTYQPVVVS